MIPLTSRQREFLRAAIESREDAPIWYAQSEPTNMTWRIAGKAPLAFHSGFDLVDAGLIAEVGSGLLSRYRVTSAGRALFENPSTKTGDY